MEPDAESPDPPRPGSLPAEVERVAALLTELGQNARRARRVEQSLAREAVGIAHLGASLQVLAVNDTFVQMLGAGSRGDLVGRPVLGCFADPAESVRCSALLSHGVDASGESHFRRSDGGQLHARYIITRLHDVAGNTVSTVLQLIDLAPWREAGRRALAERALLQGLIDASPDWIFATDHRHRLTLFNAAFARGVGAEPRTLLGRSVAELAPMGAPFYCGSGPLIEQTVRNTDNRTRLADGSERVFDTVKAPCHDADGEVIGILVISRDVSECRDARRQVELAEARLRRVVDHISDAIVVDDVDGRVVFANDRFFELFGLSRSQIGQIDIRDYVAPEWHDTLLQRHQDRVAGKAAQNSFAYEGRRADGAGSGSTWRWCQSRMSRGVPSAPNPRSAT